MRQVSMKLGGPWEVRRTFKIPALSRTADAGAIEQALTQVSGIRALSVDLSRHLVRVRYETTETDYEAIRDVLAEAGFPLADGWLARTKHQWLQNLDITSRENAGVRPSPCCNKPPVAKR